MKKRFLSAILSVAMAASLVTGYAGSSPGTADTKAENAKTGGTKADGGAEAEKKNTQAVSGEYAALTAMDGYAPRDPHGQYIYQHAEEFIKENPGVKVGIQVIVPGDIYAKLVAMATSPDGLSTMLFIFADQVSTFYDLDLTEDLANWMDKEATDGLADGAMDARTIDGQMTYYPVAAQPQAVIYRMDRFEEAGLEVPATWDEFVDCAKALTKDLDGDEQVDRWGFFMVGSNNSSGQSRSIPYLWGSGYELAYRKDGSDEWKTDITTDLASADVFSKWTDMNSMEGVVPTGITEVGYPMAANYSAVGYASMFLTGPNALGAAYVNNPELKGRLGPFKLPGEYSGTMLGAEGCAIATKSTGVQKAVAAKYPELFISHDKDMKFWEPSGKILSTTERQKVSYIVGDDYVGFLKQIEDGYCPTLAFAGISELKSALGDVYAAVFSNEKTNGQAVEQLVKDLGQLLKDYN